MLEYGTATNYTEEKTFDVPNSPRTSRWRPADLG